LNFLSCEWSRLPQGKNFDVWMFKNDSQFEQLKVRLEQLSTALKVQVEQLKVRIELLVVLKPKRKECALSYKNGNR
jgi:hypothetical protein